MLWWGWGRLPPHPPPTPPPTPKPEGWSPNPSSCRTLYWPTTHHPLACPENVCRIQIKIYKNFLKNGGFLKVEKFFCWQKNLFLGLFIATFWVPPPKKNIKFARNLQVSRQTSPDGQKSDPPFHRIFIYYRRPKILQNWWKKKKKPAVFFNKIGNFLPPKAAERKFPPPLRPTPRPRMTTSIVYLSHPKKSIQPRGTLGKWSSGGRISDHWGPAGRCRCRCHGCHRWCRRCMCRTRCRRFRRCGCRCFLPPRWCWTQPTHRGDGRRHRWTCWSTVSWRLVEILGPLFGTLGDGRIRKICRRQRRLKTIVFGRHFKVKAANYR